MIKTMKNFECVAYSSQQYAPALCLWREEGELDAIQFDAVIDRVRVGYMDNANIPVKTPRLHNIYSNASGREYVIFDGIRYFLDCFITC